MRIGILTREYPPHVYGGAGVHVDFLVRELRELVDVDVHCMGDERPGATAHSEHEPFLADANATNLTHVSEASNGALLNQLVGEYRPTGIPQFVFIN